MGWRKEDRDEQGKNVCLQRKRVLKDYWIFNSLSVEKQKPPAQKASGKRRENWWKSCYWLYQITVTGWGVMNTEGTWWGYLCFRKTRRMGGCVAENAAHIKYSWTACMLPSLCEIRSVPQNGQMIWAEIRKILLRLTVLKSSMSSSSVKSVKPHVSEGADKRWEEVSLICVGWWFKWRMLIYCIKSLTFQGLSLVAAEPLLSWRTQGLD